MDRETRKANFKKLQLPAPKKSRTTRASKRADATEIISKYFDTPQKAETEGNVRLNQELLGEPRRKPSGRGQPIKLSTFLFKSEDSVTETEVPKKKPRESDFFEPTQRKVKKAPKLKNATTRPARKTRAKGQPNIKSAFLRNEQMFAEITAKHCLADDFSPDDIRLALAISQSEVDSASGQTAAEEIADINQRDSVRAKLQKYGFRTAAKEDYSVQAFNSLPYTTRGRRAKWENKFTALTLRQPERQAKKLQENIEALMAQQCKVRPQNDNGNAPLTYIVQTAKLARVVAAKDCEIVTKTTERCPNDLNDFYVNELFQTCTVPAGHLLKNWAAIQGRDFTPEPPNSKSRARARKLREVYAELEEHFGKKPLVVNSRKKMAYEPKQSEKLSTEAAVCDDELSKLIQLIKADMVHTQTTETQNSQGSVNSTPAEEPPDKRVRIHTVIGEEDSITYTAQSIENSQTTRATSPDIFADSDEDDEQPSAGTDTPTMLNFSTQMQKLITMQADDHYITSYETYSSDEVKTSSCADNVTRSTPSAFSLSLNKSIDINQEVADEIETIRSTPGVLPCVKDSTTTEIMESDCVFELSSESESDNEDMVIKYPNSSPIISQLNEDAALQHTIGSERESDSEDVVIKFPDSSPKISQLSGNAELQDTIGSESERENEGVVIKFPDSSPKISHLSANAALQGSTGSETENDNEDVVIKYTDSSPIISQVSVDAALQDTTGETSSLNFEQKKPNLSLDLNQLFHVDNDDGLSQAIDYPSPAKSRNSNSFSLDVGHECSQTSLHSFKLPRNTSADSSLFSGVARNESSHSIDLTADESDDENFIILSDDEINYSIRKADKTLDTKESVSHGIAWQFENTDSSSNSTLSDTKGKGLLDELQLSPQKLEYNDLPATRQSIPNFDHDDEMEAFFFSTQTSLHSSGNSHSPNKSALSRERAEFGIMDAALSEPFTESELVSQPLAEQTAIDWTADASFLDASSAHAAVSVKRFSSNRRSRKFDELLADVLPQQPAATDTDEIGDEFDRLVCGAMESVYKLKAQENRRPSGFDKLLTGELSFQVSEDAAKAKTPTPKKTHQEFEVPEQLEVNGNVYTVRVCTSPKPDYTNMPDEELLKQLYNFGIKPLNRRQATKMLEFIYNQTHPIMLDTDRESTATIQPKPLSWSKSKSTSALPNDTARKQVTGEKHLPLTQIKSAIFASPPIVDSNEPTQLKLHDAFGDQLLRYSQQLQAALTSDDEWFVLQTNISKKTPQPLLPLHIAWHNLLCANPTLHECVLKYEPIDLQEIYLYLKSLGYRYDPKDLKSFLDRRCIIFRYDLNAAAGKPAANRHTRKTSR